MLAVLLQIVRCMKAGVQSENPATKMRKLLSFIAILLSISLCGEYRLLVIQFSCGRQQIVTLCIRRDTLNTF